MSIGHWVDVHFSWAVVNQAIQLGQVESGQMGNYTKIDQSIDRFRYRIGDLAITGLMHAISKQHSHAKIGYTRY